MAMQQSQSDVYARLIQTLLDELANGQGKSLDSSVRIRKRKYLELPRERTDTDGALLRLNHVVGTGLLMPALTLVDKGDGEVEGSSIVWCRATH